MPVPGSDEARYGVARKQPRPAERPPYPPDEDVSYQLPSPFSIAGHAVDPGREVLDDRLRDVVRPEVLRRRWLPRTGHEQVVQVRVRLEAHVLLARKSVLPSLEVALGADLVITAPLQDEQRKVEPFRHRDLVVPLHAPPERTTAESEDHLPLVDFERADALDGRPD